MKKRSLSLLITILISNVFGMFIGYFLEYRGYEWFDEPLLSTTVMYLGYWVMIGSLSVLTLLCSWGPGAIWIRAIAMLLASTSLWLIIYATELLRDGLSEFLISYGPEFVEVLVITVPLMMTLTFVAAFGRWRIGPPSEQPIRIRIVDIMIGTAAMALLFVATQGEDQRFTVTFSVIAIPISTIVIAASAWCLINRYAWIFVAAVLTMLCVFLYIQNPDDKQEYLIICCTIPVASASIAINVWLLGRAGWPLTRRRPTPGSGKINGGMSKLTS
ncbi:MAG: hypothetical protein AAGG48_11840 [Planctomycetota bacterium]